MIAQSKRTRGAKSTEAVTAHWAPYTKLYFQISMEIDVGGEIDEDRVDSILNGLSNCVLPLPERLGVRARSALVLHVNRDRVVEAEREFEGRRGGLTNTQRSILHYIIDNPGTDVRSVWEEGPATTFTEATSEVSMLHHRELIEARGRGRTRLHITSIGIAVLGAP